MSPTDWVAASAVATFVLALGTVFLAWEARREAKAVEEQGKHIVAQAKATRDQADAVANQADAMAGQLEITRRAFRASIQPLLTIGSTVDDGSLLGEGPARISDRTTEGTPFGIHAFVRVLNVGSGLAVIRPDESKILGWGSDPHDFGRPPSEYVSGAVSNPILRPGDERTVEFIIPKASSGLDTAAFTNQRIGSMQGTDGEFFVDIVYGDAMNESRTRARFHFAYVKGAGWVTDSVSYFTPPESTKAEIVASMR